MEAIDWYRLDDLNKKKNQAKAACTRTRRKLMALMGSDIPSRSTTSSNYFNAKAFQKLLTILFNKFFLYLLRFLPYFLIISFFLICVYYVWSVLHASYLYFCFVNISAYIPTEVPARLSNLFYTNSLFLFL